MLLARIFCHLSGKTRCMTRAVGFRVIIFAVPRLLIFFQLWRKTVAGPHTGPWCNQEDSFGYSCAALWMCRCGRYVSSCG